MDLKRSWVGWLCIGVFIALWDRYCDTLSGGFGRALFHKKKRPFVVAAWLVTSLHLFQRLPKKLDPFCYIGGIIRK